MSFKDTPEHINRNGRPKKGTTITDLISAKLDKEDFVNKVIELGKKDPQMMKYIIDRIDGKVTEKVDLNVNSFAEWAKRVSTEE